MATLIIRLLATLLLTVGCVQPHTAQASAKPDGTSVFGEFVGSTPSDGEVGRLFRIPAHSEPPLQWKLTLYRDSRTRQPSGYKLRLEYDARIAAPRGSVRQAVPLEREGRWKITRGTNASPNTPVYELSGTVSLARVNGDLLHLLNPDRSLMIGNGGWSYTLNRAGAAERIVIPTAEFNRRSESYTISPLATGPSVYGVFEGRSPAQRISRELKIDSDPSRFKAKWRLTLYRDPRTSAPTTYKVEGTLFRSQVREGTWSVVRDAGASNAVYYRLAPARSEAALFLLKGDDNVLFFLDRNRKPLIGNADFSYTLNRRDTARTARGEPATR